MASADRELEQQLMEAGNRLLQHPCSVDELLLLLDQVENFLSRVEQSPPKSMQDALAPSLKALVEDELLRHSDFDVKVAVASCISEITRITAPDAPYNDDKMKDVFQLIVSSFENLSDKSSRSYNKRASILETVSKVRSCVVMLDLECDGLIVEMFQHFLKSIRDYHPENVFMSMETIMTLVLEESEDISRELLTPLLASVNRNNEEVLPIARKLGEKVFKNCAVKLKPDLTQTMKSLGVSLDDYSKVVASICEGTSGAVEHNDGNASGEQLVDENKLTTASSDIAQVAKEFVAEEVCPEEVDPVVDRSPKAVVSNGITEAGNEGTSVDLKSFKEPEHDYLANQSLKVNLTNKGETDDSDAGKLVKSEVKPEQTAKRRRRKPNSSINSMEPFDSSCVVSEKEAEKLPDRRKSRSKDVCTSPREDLSVETTVPSENEKDTGIQISSSKALEIDAVNVASPSPSRSVPDESRPKKTGRPKKKESLVQEVAPTVPSENEKETGIRLASSKASESDAVNVASPSPSGSLLDESRPKKAGRPKMKEFVQEVALSVNDVSVKASEATCDSEVKSLRRSGKKATPGITKDDKILSGIETSKNEGGTSDLEAKPLRQSSKKGVVGDSEAKPLKQSGKKGGASDSEAKMQKQSIKKGDATSNNEDKSSLKKENGKRRGRGKDTKEKALTISSTNDDEMVSSPKSFTKLAKDEGCVEDTPKIDSKRKRTPGTGKDKVSETAEFGENLVGSKVKVWWPTDRRFYEGVVDSFDPAIKKHKVLYDDGEEEILHLRNERWELIQCNTVSDGEQATEDPRPDASSEMHKKKKAKTSSEPQSVKQEKMQVSPNKRDEAAAAASSKLKGGGTATKSGRKSKDDVKVDSKAKDISLKGDTGSKSKDHSKKTGGGKSVDDAPPGSVNKSKDQVDGGAPKTTAKSKSSKGKSPQSGSKSNASSNGAGKVKKSKVKETKGRTPDSNTESDAKSGKKRRRGAKG